MPKIHKKFDLLVIGSGPAGEAAAMNAAKAGKKVAIVSDKPRPGGNCTFLGTIPSKAIRYSVKQVIHFHTNPLLRDLCDMKKLTFQQALENAERVIYEQSKSRLDAYERNNVPVFQGRACFIDTQQIEVTDGNQT